MKKSATTTLNLSAATLPVIARLFDQSGTVVSVFDEQDRLVYANQAYYDLVCYPCGTQPIWSDIIRDNHAQGHGLIIETDDVESWIQTALSKRRAQLYRQFEVDAWDGRWLLITETLIPDLGLLGVGVDITRTVRTSEELKKEFHNAQARAETDLLTGFGNRHALERLTSVLINAAHDEVAALMIDIDQFKEYNDTLGHSRGDTCLQDVTRVIRNSLRTSDTFPIRLGGDEFLVLVSGASEQMAKRVADRIIDSIRECSIPHPTAECGYVTLSIGYASRKVVDATSFSRMLEDADQALYKAKRRGRNRRESF